MPLSRVQLETTPTTHHHNNLFKMREALSTRASLIILRSLIVRTLVSTEYEIPEFPEAFISNQT